MKKYLKNIVKGFILGWVLAFLWIVLRYRKVRIFFLYNRFGHFLVDTESLFVDWNSGKENTSGFINFVCLNEGAFPNKFMLEMLKRQRYIFDSAIAFAFFNFIAIVGDKYFKGKVLKEVVYHRHGGLYLNFNQKNQTCHFSQKDHKAGDLLLKQLGLPDGSKWITIHNRDPVYLESKVGRRLEHEDYRNFPISDLEPVAKLFANSGFHVIRIGSLSEERLLTNHPMVVDYSNSQYRSDFGDIYLGGNSCGHFGSDSGVSSIPVIFRKPVTTINAPLTGIRTQARLGGPDYLVIFKKIRRKCDGKFVPLREILQIYPEGFETEHYRKRGWEVLSNTEDEIYQTGVEFISRINSEWVESKQDIELKEKFWEIFLEFNPDMKRECILCNVGSAFLRKNKYLCD